MGYQLRRGLREVLGPDVTGLQRAVALEIADDAREDTRVSMAPLEDLARWAGAKDEAVVRNALKRLAAAGWEFRTPIGKGKDGRILYAVPGRRMTFRVPEFEGVAPALSFPQGGATAHSEGAGATPYPPQGGAGAHSEGAVAHSEGAVAPPSSSYSSSPSGKKGAEEQTEAATDDRYPDDVLPLVHAMTASGLHVRWPWAGNAWFPIIALIRRCGVRPMVEHAHRSAAAAREPVSSAKYFLQGWKELPPAPPEDTPNYRPQPHLRVAGRGYQSPEERGIF